MTLRFEKRLRQLESSKRARRRPNFSRISQNDLRNWREVLTAATDSGDWSGYLDDLAVDAPSVYAAYIEAGYRET